MDAASGGQTTKSASQKYCEVKKVSRTGSTIAGCYLDVNYNHHHQQLRKKKVASSSHCKQLVASNVVIKIVIIIINIINIITIITIITTIIFITTSDNSSSSSSSSLNHLKLSTIKNVSRVLISSRVYNFKSTEPNLLVINGNNNQNLNQNLNENNLLNQFCRRGVRLLGGG